LETAIAALHNKQNANKQQQATSNEQRMAFQNAN
jgi:hypothetical protein